MTNYEIYCSAIRLASEIPDSDATQDYEDRAPYLIAAAAHRYAPLDVSYRRAHDLDEQQLLALNCFPLTTSFPLSDIFAPAVSSAVAGMLVLEENPKLSDQLLKMADSIISDIQQSIPFKKEKILSHYVF